MVRERGAGVYQDRAVLRVRQTTRAKLKLPLPGIERHTIWGNSIQGTVTNRMQSLAVLGGYDKIHPWLQLYENPGGPGQKLAA